MIWIALAMVAVGLALSALFSGSETGFYRATRIRLVLDALGGDLVSRWLVWLTNRPTLFIATTLVGNNLANYLVSLAIVVGTQAALAGESRAAELLAPMLLAPLLFVYGELMPKNLFLNAPNRLLRKAAPLLLVCLPLFLPISVLLWGLNWVLSKLLGESPQRVHLTVARRELRRALEEGHATGILHPSQRELAQGIFAVAKEPVAQYVTPLDQVARARADMSKDELRQLARRCGRAVVPIEDGDEAGRLTGYIRAIDVLLNPSGPLGPLRPLTKIPATATLIDSMMRLQAAKEPIAQVVDASGDCLGILTAERLHQALLGSRLATTT